MEGATVRACLDAVEARHPGFGSLIFDPGGNLHGFVRLFVNEEPVEADAPIRPADTLTVVAAIAGGRGRNPRRGGGLWYDLRPAPGAGQGGET